MYSLKVFKWLTYKEANNMHNINNFVFCLSSGNSDGANNINGVLSVITPEYVPGLYSFGVNFAILDLTQGPHNLCLQFMDSDDIEVASIGGATVNYTKDPNSNLPDEYLGVNVSANFQNVNITHSGIYFMNVILDDTNIGSFKIFVKGKNESA